MTIEQIGNSIYTGLSGDDKYSILNPNTNAIFIERDSGVIFRFNATWNIVNTSGSGGGGSGTGSINSASNVGSSGEGWFKGINFDDLQFKKAKAGSNVVSLASSVDNVTIDIVQSNLNLGLMGGVASESSLPIASETLKGIVELSKADGTENIGTRVIQDNDPRLTNTRTPAAHFHAGTDVNSGLIPAAQLPAATTTVKGAVILSTDSEATANEVVTATDSRLTNARSPTLHATTHKTGGSDVIKLDELGAPTNVTTLNVSTTAHGLTPILPNDITMVLRGDGTYGTMAPPNANYVTLTTNTVLSNERVLTAGTNNSFVDGGAGSTLTINVPDATTLVKGAVELATDGESAANVVVQGNDSRMSNARTPLTHVHDTGDITTGTMVAARLPDASETAKGIVELATNIETTAGLVVQANDSRLSDSRSPLAHVHSGADITSGTIGVGVLPTASTSAKGISQLATSSQTTAGLTIQASDMRLSDPRTPTSHVHGNADITDLAYSKLTGVPSTFTPSAHNHSAAEITSGTLAVAQGGTNKSTITQHALLKGGASNTYSEITAGTEGHVLKVVSGTPAWAAETGGGGTLTGVSNVGTGDGTVYRDTTSGTINLKTVKAGTNVTVTNNADDITISATGSGGGSMTASSLGTGEGTVFKDIVGSQMNFRSLRQGTNVTISQDANEITINSATVPDATETVKGIVELSKADGTENTGTRVIQDNDPRLTNSRTPTSHVHSGADITSGTVPIAQLPVASTTAKGIVELATSVETTSGLAISADDTRLSDSRTPTAHSHGNADITDLAYSKLTGVPSSFAPTAHATTHKSGGTDSIKLDELAAPTDITTLNVSSTAHGLTPKHPNDVTQVLRGDGTYGAMAPFAASYLTLATNTVLTNERVLTQGTNISLVDGGAGSTLTLNVPDASTSVKGAVQLGISSDTAANLAVQTNDTRLSNARTPTAHKDTHKVGGGDAFVKGDDLNTSAKYLEDVVDPASDGQRIWIEDTTANIKYWSDEAVPVKHVIERQANKGAASGYASLDSGTLVPVAQLPAATTTTKGVVELATSGENASNVVVQGDDSRLSNARTPTAHNTTHMSAGGDPLRIDELKIGTDVTTLNATTTEHGLLKKLSNSASQYMDGTGNWSTPPSGAPVAAQYLTLATDTTLTVERVLTSGTNIAFVDGGAGSTLTVNVPDGTTGTKGAVQLGTSVQTTSGLAVQTSDTRLSDSRVPTLHKDSHKAGGTDQFVKGDDLNASSRYLEDIADMASDSQRIWIDDATANVKYWSDEASPVKHTIASASNTISFTNKTWDADGTGNSITNIEDADIKAAANIATTKLADSTNFVLTTRANTYGDFLQTFRNSRIKIMNPANTFGYTFTGGAIVADRIINLPLMTGTDEMLLKDFAATITNKSIDADTNTVTNIENADIKAAAGIVTTKLADSTNFVLTTRTNTFGDFDNIYKDNRIRINNPADTFSYTVIAAAIAANRNVTLPLLTGDDTFVTQAFAQALTNKTFDADLNTVSNIENADIKAAAAIAVSKLAAGTDTHVLTTVAGVPTWAAPTGGGMTASSVDTLTNKTYDADATGNVLSNIDDGNIKASAGIVTTKLADSTNFVLTTRANTHGDFNTTFKDNRLLINNPADTFAYTIIGAAIAAARNVTLPLLTGNDTFVTEAFIQTMTNKTLTAPTISTITNSGTITIPTGTDQLVGRATTDTLTNKTINGLDLNVNAKTASYTATSTDDFIPCAPAANMTITLPAASTSSGFLYTIIKTNSNAFTVTIDPNASETINGSTTLVITSQYQTYAVWCDGAAWYTTPFSTERRGYTTASGNGSSTSFSIPHGLGSVPHDVLIQCSSHSTAFTYTLTSTNIVVVFGTAPPSGTNNVIFYWSAVP